jgi:diguanylate cyclase (GGDEF)-like protein
VAIIDLDRFKEVNDTLGHQAGDRLLIEAGRRLRRTLGASDTIARLGGDEFALILPRVRDGRDAAAVAARIAEALGDPVSLDGVLIQLDASVGIALHPDHGDDPGTLLRHADVAMYEAKRDQAGHLLYSTAYDPYSPDRLGLVAELRRALDDRALVLHYQPKVSVDGGVLHGVEALVRWPHATRGLIAPGEFIPLAEHTGLIRPLTVHVLELALAQCRRWLDDGLAIPIAVNISARSLLDEAFPDELAAQLHAAGVPPELLELEVTESSMLESPERARVLLDRLSAMGVAIAVDDFGTGYSSMAQLKALPVRRLKIDRGFIAAMGEDDRDAFIVRSAIQLGHDLGMAIVAEGVEDERTLQALHGLGCDAAQGFYIQRPVAPEQLADWLHEHGRTRTIVELTS